MSSVRGHQCILSVERGGGGEGGAGWVCEVEKESR